MTNALANSRALVTGATSGIGRAIALALAESGANVCLNHLQREEETAEVAGEIEALGREAMLYDADVSDLPEMEKMAAAVAKRWGGLDIAVANAYTSEREPLVEADMQGFRRTIDVTMWGALHTFRAAAQQMVRQGQGGSLIAIGSPHAFLPLPDCMAYNMSKAAVLQMAKTAALELAEHKIRVNVVHPGWTDTPGERKYYTEEQLARGGAKLPLGRLATPEDIARAVVFFCNPANAYVTGASLLVDGGITLPWWAAKGKLD